MNNLNNIKYSTNIQNGLIFKCDFLTLYQNEI